ncbi:MAG: HXXEE domain-containing protein [Bacteroidales bacterium]|nr:HXXEE domain-containing protein [Bacteroidales bacterium]
MNIQRILYLATFLLFVIHETEEILLFHKWLNRNGGYLKKKFPRIGKRLTDQFSHISTHGFIYIAIEETILLTSLLLYTWYAVRPEIWIGIVVMLSIHWSLTIIQSVILGRMIPGTVTSIAGTCFGTTMLWLFRRWYSLPSCLLWGIVLFAFAMINLLLMHRIVAKYSAK